MLRRPPHTEARAGRRRPMHRPPVTLGSNEGLPLQLRRRTAKEGFVMAKAPRRTWLVAAAVVVSFTTVSLASAGSSQKPGIHNGVITACVEPPTKGNKATS